MDLFQYQVRYDSLGRVLKHQDDVAIRGGGDSVSEGNGNFWTGRTEKL